ncbi:MULTISPECIES: GNAT family N-acetyltransferase [Photorhabdus]|uniref:N-acetyltransferase domain-containing protein n=1 Tax=Photorhabdus thracensis TaxID=230089 RepID=A0A0F7LN23_9GAMM|nr:GNAT family N-acetyltransferase [Photorhabdus thracensis]AKH63221.1 hypothetical protein VY86_07595 [Photorhabdus thracensis]MCC8421888.1 GNAT family N-acetyltransferase [Photorhabdus thracensis]
MAVVIGSASELNITIKMICDFYKKHWSRPIILTNEDFYIWQFINNPCNKSIDNCCVAIDYDKVVGIMGLNERDFVLDGAIEKGAELTTWVIAESHRNKGCGPKMIEYLKNKYSVMIGMGISQTALPVYIRNGFKYIKSIPRYVHVISWDNISSLTTIDPLAKKYAKGQLKKVNYNILDFSKDDINNLYKEFSKNYNSFSRTHDDIYWRYNEHPYFKYEYVIIEAENKTKCFVAYRIDRNIDGLIMAHCLDIFGDKQAYSAGISFIADIAKINAADAIDIYATNSSLVSELKCNGWFSTLDDDFFKFPHLFHPIEVREPATTSLILWSSKNINILLDTGKLHITKQDADLDRPTLYKKDV